MDASSPRNDNGWHFVSTHRASLRKESKELEAMFGTRIDIRVVEITKSINGSVVGEEDGVNIGEVRGETRVLEYVIQIKLGFPTSLP